MWGDGSVRDSILVSALKFNSVKTSASRDAQLLPSDQFYSFCGGLCLGPGDIPRTWPFHLSSDFQMLDSRLYTEVFPKISESCSAYVSHRIESEK